MQLGVRGSFEMLAMFTAAAALFGVWRYGTVINPLTAFAVYRIGVATILSGLVAVAISNGSTFTEASAEKTILLSATYLCGAWSAYIFGGRTARRTYGRGLQALGFARPSIARTFRWQLFLGFLGAGAVAFSLLAVVGGGGLLWITDPRQAYQFYRVGAGPFYAATQWSVTLALAYVLWSRRLQGWRMWAWIAAIAVLLLATGSKGNVLTVLVVGIVYRHFYVAPVTLLGAIGFLFAAALLFGGLFLVFGNGAELIDVARYFQEYFATSATMIDRFGEIGFRHGGALLSGFWALVPRALFPAKPFVYGPTLVHDLLFPGAAAAGSTPGNLDWTVSYLDFGVVGVIVFAWLDATLQRAAFEYFLETRDQFVAFLLAMHLSIWTIWLFVPYLFLVPFVAVIVMYLRLTWTPAAGHRSARRDALDTPLA
jgi:hypothetical protein